MRVRAYTADALRLTFRTSRGITWSPCPARDSWGRCLRCLPHAVVRALQYQTAWRRSAAIDLLEQLRERIADAAQTTDLGLDLLQLLLGAIAHRLRDVRSPAERQQSANLLERIAVRLDLSDELHQT